MSEIEELTKQRSEIQAQQTILANWVALKKNLQIKFKNPSETFKGLIKENAHELTISDFDEYSKGLNLTELFKDTHLDEETFVKVWEQWEFKARANEHKLQMIDEKIEVLAILEDKDQKIFKEDPAKKKLIVSQIKGCENLEELHKKLGEMAQSNSASKSNSEVVLNESNVFTEYLAKKSKIQFNELSISKMQVKLSEIPQKQDDQSNEKPHQNSDQKLVESQIIVSGKVTLPKKSYLELQHSIIHKKGNYSQNQSKTFIADSGHLRLVSPKMLRPKETFKSPQPFSIKPNFEENEVLRRSQKSKKLKGDLQNYIGELFQTENQKKPYYETQQRGLAGFTSNTKIYKNSQQPKIEFKITDNHESAQIQRRVENIRNKLSDFANKQYRRRHSPQSKQLYFAQGAYVRSDKTPERRYSAQRQGSPYTPGNTRRLNVERLKKEQELEKQQSGSKPIEKVKEIQEGEGELPKQFDRQKAFISD